VVGYTLSVRIVDPKALRMRYRLTQAQVAERAGVKPSEVSAVENGVAYTPGARERVLDAIRDLARPQVGLTPEVRAEILAIFDAVAATHVRVFGSVATGTDQPGSDIDFVAKFPDGFSLFSMVELESDLEDLLGVNVDVVSDHPRGGRALAEITRTAVPLAP
jgi:predicted nucleotidyltransferase